MAENLYSTNSHFLTVQSNPNAVNNHLNNLPPNNLLNSTYNYLSNGYIQNQPYATINSNINRIQSDQANRFTPQNTLLNNPSSISQFSYKNPSFIHDSNNSYSASPSHISVVKQIKTPITVVRFNNQNQPHIVHRSNNLISNKSNLKQYRSNVSPINIRNNQNQSRNLPDFKTIQNLQMQRYEALRWQNKYEDLKTKYFQVLSILQNKSEVEDAWILEEQNKLLRQKIKILEEKDQKYYNQVTQKLEKIIDFHQNTTSKQCELLIDRFRLQNKFLQKL